MAKMKHIRPKHLKLQQVNKRPHWKYYVRKYVTPVVYVLFIIETGYLIYASF